MLIEKEALSKVEENEVSNSLIKLDKLFESLSEMPSDFYAEERVGVPPQERVNF